MGGILDATDKAPYQVSLQVLVERANKTRYHHFCGGSILTPSYILTAAHCLKGFPSERMSVVAGTKVWDVGGMRRGVNHYEIHESYRKLRGFDIGLITLEQPLEFGPKVYYLFLINNITKNNCMVKKKQIKGIKFDDRFVAPEVDCILTGWGYTLPIRDPGLLPKWVHAILKSYPKELQITALRTISNDECRQTYGSMPLTTELCTYKWGTGACSVS